MPDLQDTKYRILNAAERLFAENGFHATSLRQLTREAGVNLAAVNYHFGSKEALVEEVISRRLLPLNAERASGIEAALAGARAESRRPLPDEVLRAFIAPSLRFAGEGEGARNFIGLIGRVMGEPDPAIREVFLQFMEPVLGLLTEGLREALPDIPEDVLYWRLQFTLGALSHIMRVAGLWTALPGGKHTPKNPSELVGPLVAFLTAGFETAP